MVLMFPSHRIFPVRQSRCFGGHEPVARQRSVVSKKGMPAVVKFLRDKLARDQEFSVLTGEMHAAVSTLRGCAAYVR
jgi:hypothetical protein